MKMLLQKEMGRLKKWQGARISGKVTHVIGLLIESLGPKVSLGELCYIYGKQGEAIPCQVVGFKEQKVLLMALGEMSSISCGSEVYPTEEVPNVAVSLALCGRVLDAMGKPMDGRGDIPHAHYLPVTATPPSPLKRAPISEILPTGVKAIDGLTTLGKGQRIGIFAGPGVGKSTLMGMIANSAMADVNVIALIGERGREVRQFIENELGAEGLARSVVVVATSDQAAPLRVKGAHVATTIAEYFRSMGKHVILMMDSISRYASALMEMGLAIGEPPTHRGYPPSVFALLPRLLERAGNAESGSITGIYTLLVEADERHDPIADQVRSLLDGHILLSKELAHSVHFPPIDVLSSLSRLMHGLVTPEHERLASKLRSLLHVYNESRDLINIGAYVKGSNPKIDEALAKIGAISLFLQQQPKEAFSFSQILLTLEKTLL